MITLDKLRNADPATLGNDLGYTCMAMVRTARLALENQTSGQPASEAAATVLELAEELMGAVIDAIELTAKKGGAA